MGAVLSKYNTLEVNRMYCSIQVDQAYTLYCHVATFVKGFSELFYVLLRVINAI